MVKVDGLEVDRLAAIGDEIQVGVPVVMVNDGSRVEKDVPSGAMVISQSDVKVNVRPGVMVRVVHRGVMVRGVRRGGMVRVVHRGVMVRVVHRGVMVRGVRPGAMVIEILLLAG